MAELVLVTGGSGYVVGWCIAELLRRGYDVRTTVRDPGREQAVADAVSSVVGRAGRLSFAVADLTADDGWDAAVKGVDYVLHVASPLGGGTADAMIAAARDGTLRVLRAPVAARAKRVVMTSAANAASPSSYATEGVTDETPYSAPSWRRAPSVRSASSGAWCPGPCAPSLVSAWRSSTSATWPTSTSAR
jgi:dihydroflavonol-4-reductase